MPPNISVVPMFAMPVCFHVHSAILDFRGPVMGSLKSSCTNSYRSSIETIVLNCLVFEKIVFFFAFWRQTDRQTNRWTASMHKAALAVASGGLKRDFLKKSKQFRTMVFIDDL